LAIENRLIPLLQSHTAWNRRSIHPHDLEKTHNIKVMAIMAIIQTHKVLIEKDFRREA